MGTEISHFPLKSLFPSEIKVPYGISHSLVCNTFYNYVVYSWQYIAVSSICTRIKYIFHLYSEQFPNVCGMQYMFIIAVCLLVPKLKHILQSTFGNCLRHWLSINIMKETLCNGRGNCVDRSTSTVPCLNV